MAFAALLTEDCDYEFRGTKDDRAKNTIAFREHLFKNSPHRHHNIVRCYIFGMDDQEATLWDSRVAGQVKHTALPEDSVP